MTTTDDTSFREARGAPARWLVLAAATVWLAGCGTQPAAETRTLATIDGEPVTMADVEELAGDELDQLDFQYRAQRHQLIEAALEQVVRDRLLDAEAEAQGISRDELIAAETGDSVQVSEEDVAAWYERNAAALGGRSLEELYPRIEAFLQGSRRQQIINAYAGRLREGREVVILLEPFRAELNNDAAPATGPADAPVTLTEFSDFECPYCGRFFPTLKRLQENYGDRLRVVYRQYPLDSHPNAFSAALASLCAHEQGRFWEMHDLMFSEQDRLDEESLKEKAARLELDRTQFDDCLESAKYADQVQGDIREGDRVGVRGNAGPLRERDTRPARRRALRGDRQDD